MGADLADAYCHFAVAHGELGYCFAPALEEEEVLVSVAMLFGFKAAPLTMGRLSAALARLWQSMMMKDGKLQVYMHNPLFILTRVTGLRLTWIVIQMEPNIQMKIFTLSVPEKMATELKEKVRSWKGKGMIPFRDLRATTGRLSWVAGIVSRIR